MSNPIITVEHVSKQYKLYSSKSDRLREALSLTHKQYHTPFFALDDISFEVQKGETVGIIGTNGSGKSTLLKILTGVTAATSGTVEVKGRVSALLELGAGFNAEYTGIENIDLNCTMMGLSNEETATRKADIIKFADIGDYINQPVKNYSSGMFARLAFAVAISVDPEILIVDETLSVGDMRFQIKCMDRMKQMMDGGTTILFVSHDLSAIRRFCQKSIWIQNGKIIDCGETNRIADMYVDYLKCKEEGVAFEAEPTSKGDMTAIEPFVPAKNKDVIAEIKNISVCDRTGRTVTELGNLAPISVHMVYDVYDTSIEMPVLGVALLGIDREYMCGLNTLLDRVQIPWKYGRNELKLNYPMGLRVLGGKYHFDVALFDKTATAAIQYCKAAYEITVTSGYIAEGKFNIPHKWE